MSETGKEIKFKVSIDEQAARRVDDVLSGLIKRAQELAKTLNGAMGGSLLGGGSVGGGRTSRESGMASRAGGPASKTFNGVLNANLDVFKKMGEAGRNAMSAIGDSMDRNIAKQSASIDRLKSRLNSLGEAYDKIVAKDDKTNDRYARIVAGMSNRIASREKDLRKLQSEKDAITNAFGAVGGGGVPGVPGAAGAGGGAGGKGGGGGGLSSMLGAMGMGRLGLATIASWGLAGIKDQVLNQPMEFVNSQAAYAQAHAAQYMNPMQGQFKHGFYRGQAISDPTWRNDYRRMDTMPQYAWDSIKGFLSLDFEDTFSGRRQENAIAGRREQFLKKLEESDPAQSYVLTQAQNIGNRSLGRAMGLGPAKDSRSYLESLARHRVGYSNFDDSEIVAAFQGISGSGTRGAAYGLQGRAMSGTAAGVHGMTGMLGTVAKIAGSSAAATLDNMIRGRTGMDASTMGVMNQYLTSQIGAYGVNTGNGIGSGLLDFVGSGTGGALGRGVLEQNIRGAGLLEAGLRGQTSPYQSFRNVQNAFGVLGGAGGAYDVATLGNNVSLMDYTEATKGRTSGFWRAGGISAADIAAQGRGSFGSILEGISSKGFTKGTNAQRFMEAYESSGQDLVSFAQTGSKELGMSRDERKNALAYALAQTGPYLGKQAEAMGAAEDLMNGRVPTLGKGMKGAGGAGSIETQEATEQLKTFKLAVEHATTALKQLVDPVTQAVNRFSLLNPGTDSNKLRDLEQFMRTQTGQSYTNVEDYMKFIQQELNNGEFEQWRKAEADRAAGRTSGKPAAPYGGYFKGPKY